jgi:hypothetical protein
MQNTQPQREHFGCDLPLVENKNIGRMRVANIQSDLQCMHGVSRVWPQ